MTNEPQNSPPSPRPAATVVLLRQNPRASDAEKSDAEKSDAEKSDAEKLEFYLVKRHGRSGFMAGAHVFPGGRVDRDDAGWAKKLSRTAADHASSLLGPDVARADAIGFCIAAIRETAEECGVLLARDSGGALASAATAAAVFEALCAGQEFHALLAAQKLLPDVEALAAWAWWVTPEAEPKRYDTRFFLAPAPAAQKAQFDAHEVTEGEWMTAKVALARYRAGEIILAPPTLATLEDLGAATDFASASAAAEAPRRKIMPVLHTPKESADGNLFLTVPGDRLHPVPGDQVLGGKTPEPIWPQRRSRFVLETNGRFVSSFVGSATEIRRRKVP